MFFGKSRVFIGLNGWAESLISLIHLHRSPPLSVITTTPKRSLKCSAGIISLQDIVLPNGTLLQEHLQAEQTVRHGGRTWTNLYTALKGPDDWIAESRWTSDDMAIFAIPCRASYPFHASRASRTPYPLVIGPSLPSVKSFFAQQTVRPS